jgi:hypothetical protein
LWKSECLITARCHGLESTKIGRWQAGGASTCGRAGRAFCHAFSDGQQRKPKQLGKATTANCRLEVIPTHITTHNAVVADQSRTPCPIRQLRAHADDSVGPVRHQIRGPPRHAALGQPSQLQGLPEQIRPQVSLAPAYRVTASTY